MLKIILGTLLVAFFALLVMWVIFKVGGAIERRRMSVEDTRMPRIDVSKFTKDK